MEGALMKSCSWTETRDLVMATVGDQRQQMAGCRRRYFKKQQVRQLLVTEGLKKLREKQEDRTSGDRTVDYGTLLPSTGLER